jgi:hypothetical protein
MAQRSQQRLSLQQLLLNLTLNEDWKAPSVGAVIPLALQACKSHQCISIPFPFYNFLPYKQSTTMAS